MHDERGSPGPDTATNGTGEVFGAAEASRRWQHRSGGELDAALTPPRRKDRAAGPGAHPQPEAMGLGAAAVVRLEGALTHENSTRS